MDQRPRRIPSADMQLLRDARAARRSSSAQGRRSSDASSSAANGASPLGAPAVDARVTRATSSRSNREQQHPSSSSDRPSSSGSSASARGSVLSGPGGDPDDLILLLVDGQFGSSAEPSSVIRASYFLYLCSSRQQKGRAAHSADGGRGGALGLGD